MKEKFHYLPNDDATNYTFCGIDWIELPQNEDTTWSLARGEVNCMACLQELERLLYLNMHNALNPVIIQEEEESWASKLQRAGFKVS